MNMWRWREWLSMTIGDIDASELSFAKMVDLVSHLNGVSIAGIAIPLLTIAHASNVFIRSRPAVKKQPISLWRSLFAFLVGSTGGSALVAQLLGCATPVFNMSTFPLLVACWALLTWSQRAIHLISEVALINAQVTMLASINMANCLFFGIETALRTMPQEYILAIICGVVYCVGGGLLVDMFHLNSAAWSFEGFPVSVLSQRLLLPGVSALIYTLSLSPMVPGKGQLAEFIKLAITSAFIVLGVFNSFWKTSEFKVPIMKPKGIRKID
uniref:Uncharacterized protein n=1 Tax=Spongospora subterranea TaxID=70186 RepID=A0A0H5R7N9_9EUKA|eukprot:CRZ09767.1 hypothetical protein [Spongospora subterranea]